jgi:hypothetical protein
VFIEDRVVHAPQEIPQGRIRLVENGNSSGHPRIDAPGQLDQDIILSREVEVERSARHAGGSSDAVDLRGAYADLAKFSQCRLEESFPRLGTLSRSQALFSPIELIRVAFREAPDGSGAGPGCTDGRRRAAHAEGLRNWLTFVN